MRNAAVERQLLVEGSASARYHAYAKSLSPAERLAWLADLASDDVPPSENQSGPSSDAMPTAEPIMRVTTTTAARVLRDNEAQAGTRLPGRPTGQPMHRRKGPAQPRSDVPLSPLEACVLRLIHLDPRLATRGQRDRLLQVIAPFVGDVAAQWVPEVIRQLYEWCTVGAITTDAFRAGRMVTGPSLAQSRRTFIELMRASHPDPWSPERAAAEWVAFAAALGHVQSGSWNEPTAALPSTPRRLKRVVVTPAPDSERDDIPLADDAGTVAAAAVLCDRPITLVPRFVLLLTDLDPRLVTREERSRLYAIVALFLPSTPRAGISNALAHVRDLAHAGVARLRALEQGRVWAAPSRAAAEDRFTLLHRDSEQCAENDVQRSVRMERFLELLTNH